MTCGNFVLVLILDLQASVCTQRKRIMTTKREPPESPTISTWLADLHMECYKKNLENYDTIKVRWISDMGGQHQRVLAIPKIHSIKEVIDYN